MIRMKAIRLAPTLIGAFTLVECLAVGVGATGLVGDGSLDGSSRIRCSDTAHDEAQSEKGCV